MDARNDWIAGPWGATLAVLIAILAASLEIWWPEAGPAVSLYLLSAIFALGLPVRQFQTLVAFLVLAIIFPILIEDSEASGFRNHNVMQRLTGLICLGFLVVVADRVRGGRPLQDKVSRPDEVIGPSHWVRALVGRPPASDLIDVGVLVEEPRLDELKADPLDVSQPLTSNLTRIQRRKREADQKAVQQDDDLSFDEEESSSDAARLVKRLRDSGNFDHTQIELIETELRSSMGNSLSAEAGVPLEKGLKIGRFIVDQPLGRGGEGNVYRGEDLGGNPAAIKILHNMRVSDRFRREMHLVRQLAHPNIVTAYEVGEFRGLPFITMELLQGPDLHVLIRDSGPLSWQVSSTYVLQAARALRMPINAS